MNGIMIKFWQELQLKMPESSTRSRQQQPTFKLFPEKWDFETVLGLYEYEMMKILAKYLTNIITLDHIITHYRLLFVLLLLPISFLYDLWFDLRQYHKQYENDTVEQINNFQKEDRI